MVELWMIFFENISVVYTCHCLDPVVFHLCLCSLQMANNRNKTGDWGQILNLEFFWSKSSPWPAHSA